jgi:simple sugar transport system ATP-binding protein
MHSPDAPPASGAAPPPLRLQLAGITKRYPSVVANSGVSLAVRPGEIHAVLGENGAGKSTLMKIIYGAVKPDEGTVQVDGRAVHIRNPQEARQLGIAMVFQHFSLFDTLSVAENVWLGLDKTLSLAEVTQRITAKAAEYGLEIDPLRPVHTLSVGEMQRVEIIRALLANPRLLILDEPTSVLTPQAVEKLFVVLRKLAGEGCSILYISHKLHEIRALCTACTVMRAGQVTGVCDPREESNASLSRLMIGAEPPALTYRAVQAGAPVLRVEGLTLPRGDAFGVDLIDLQFEVRAGEVVGIAGVSGNGQRELLYALSGEARHGADRRPARHGAQRAPEPAPAARAGPAFRARGAPGPWRRARHGAGTQPASDPWRCVGRGRVDPHARVARAGQRHHRALRRQGRGAGCHGAVAVGRQPAEIHRGPRD